MKDKRLAELMIELTEILEIKEESDSGREFHPTTISSCRCMTNERLGEIFKEVRELEPIEPKPKESELKESDPTFPRGVYLVDRKTGKETGGHLF